jgi:1-deoxy-D-xylulose-5-phosphate reductoisomerase
MDVQSVTVLGSTGSIGANTLDVIARNPERYRVFALTAYSQIDLLLEQCKQCQPVYAVVAQEQLASGFEQKVRHAGLSVEVLAGNAGLEFVAAHSDVDCVMAAIVGFAGLAPTMAAARAGKKILLANKEALVCAGHLLMRTIKASGGVLLPIDSEHNAIFQCLPAGKTLGEAGVERLLLTASGGPFLHWTKEQIYNATPEQACAHPNWKMGKKISVDSATMMNKGLELIEACWLFSTDPSHIQIVVHPQSIVHSLVQYRDGSTLAQLGNPDMRTPIAFGLSWPARIDAGVQALDLFKTGELSFLEPDEVRFPAMRLAADAFSTGAGCVALNAANEVAVAAFLDRRLGFARIVDVVRATVERLCTVVEPVQLEEIFALDREARVLAESQVCRYV